MDGFVDWPVDVAKRYRKLGYWEDKTLGEQLDLWVARHKDAPAIWHDGAEISYAEMDRRATAVAYGLSRLGITTYDRIIFQLYNSPELIYLTYACFKLGAIPVCALPSHRWTEIDFLAGVSKAKALAVPVGAKGFDYEPFAAQIKAKHPGIKLVLTGGPPASPDAVSVADLATRTVDPTDARRELAKHRPDPSEPAIFQLSGGTTGVPKIIPRTHNDYAYNAKCCAETEMPRSAGPVRCLIPMPMMHNFGMVCGLLPCHFLGATVIPSAPNVQSIMDGISRGKANLLMTVPVFMHSLLGVPDEERKAYDLGSLKRVLYGGNAVAPDVQDRFRRTFRCDTDQVYGMAEGLICWTRLTDSVEIKTHTQGRAVSEADEIKVADVNTGEEVRRGEIGECWTRGPYTTRGYYKSEEHNRKAFTSDGYYRTGDLVTKDAQGNMTIVGRIKDCISRGAEKVNAEEVEAHIRKFPGVKNVAVVGMPDIVMGERVCAFVVPEPGHSITLEALAEFLLAERKIARYKVPERLEFLDTLPVSAVGKFEKKSLKEKIVAILANEGGR